MYGRQHAARRLSDGVRRFRGRDVRDAQPAGGAATSTIESKTNFFRGCTGGTITGVAVPVHVGRRTIVVQTDISRDDGKLVSRTIQTQAVLSD